MPKLKNNLMVTSLSDNLWHDLTLFEKLPIKNKGKMAKRDDWKLIRNRRRSAKAKRQEYLLGTHGRQHS